MSQSLIERRLRQTARLRFQFRPTVKAIGATGRFLTDFSGTFMNDEDATSRIGMVAHELLENSLKYAVDQTADLKLEIKTTKDGQIVTLSLRNRASPNNLKALKASLARMKLATDALGHYLGAMEECADRGHGSRLGLPRIWAEGEMTVTGSFRKDLVCITARMKINHQATS